MDAKGKRGLPLGLQYVYTSLACASFASAMLAHPAASGATAIEIVTRDPRRLEDGAAEAYVHTALRMPGGDFLDAEGLRTFEALCAAFGLDPALTEARATELAPDPDSPAARLLGRVADLCGWASGAPRAAEIATATDDWQAAEDEFWERGGMSAEPQAMLADYARDLAHERRRDVSHVLEGLAEDWIADPGRRLVMDRHAISEGPCVEFAEEAEELLRERLGDGIAIEIVHSDEIAAARGLPLPGYHAFLCVDGLYYDAEETRGATDPFSIPFMRRGIRSAQPVDDAPPDEPEPPFRTR